MKSRWKKGGMLAALMALSFTAGVYAQDSVIKVTAYLRPDFKVVVDGKPAALEFPPLIYNDKSYMPFTAIASLLGATVSWKDDTKTIYVNRIIYPDKQAQQPQKGLYEEVQMSNPQPVQVQYLGRNYIILQFGGPGGLYYRVSDVEKMGIDARGLQKAKEIYTGALYVTENELQKVWKERPGYAYTEFDAINPVLVAGETDKKKIEALNKYARMTGQFTLGKIEYYSRPVFFERLDAENEYEYLHTINGKLARSRIVLKPQKEEAPGDPVVSYEVTSYNNELIEPLTPPAAAKTAH